MTRGAGVRPLALAGAPVGAKKRGTSSAPAGITAVATPAVRAVLTVPKSRGRERPSASAVLPAIVLPAQPDDPL